MRTGNHDGKWSESGANSFKKVFGKETFYLKGGKYVLLGTNCGPIAINTELVFATNTNGIYLLLHGRL